MDINILDYDFYIVAFSGGKDSTACFLHLLDHGVDISKIELWHHDIDGGGETFMDWEITHDYCQAFGDAFDVPVYYSWREGGFKRELLREDQLLAPAVFQDENFKLHKVGGTHGKKNTRRKFPQVSPDLRVRWCSPALKIDVCARAIANLDRFRGKRTLVISGERGEESPGRANYAIFEPDRTDLRNGKRYTRHVDRWRPIRDWTEKQVWQIIERYLVRVHPAYYLGYSRVSCKFCIFGNANQFASSFFISPSIGLELVQLEKEFGVTLKRDKSLVELIKSGTPYDTLDESLMDLATSSEYDLPIIMEPGTWILPAGAYGENCGPK